MSEPSVTAKSVWGGIFFSAGFFCVDSLDAVWSLQL